MKLIFLYGLPATGKLTVAQELSAITGYRLFHNHLTVDLLLSVFEFGSPSFVTLREQIWLSVVEAACESGLPGLIFTFAPERTVREGFIAALRAVMEAKAGEIEFVALTCPLPELMARMENESRRRYGKLASVSLFEQLHADGVFDPFPMPEPAVTIDTGAHSAKAAAVAIAQELMLI
jgi:hypothetical protein